MGEWRYKYIYSFLKLRPYMKVSGLIYVRLPPVTAPAVSIDIRGGMEALEKREVCCFCQESNNDFSVVQPVKVKQSRYRPGVAQRVPGS